MIQKMWILFFSILIISQCCSADESNIEVMINLGKGALLDGDYEEAVTLFDNVLDYYPDNSTALNNQGIAYLRLGNCLKAVNLFERASLDPNVKYQALLNKALSLECLDRNDDAEEIYNELILENSSDSTVLYQRAMLFYEKGSYETAMKDFQAGLSLDPENLDILRSYGVVLGALGKYDEGLRVMNESISFFPNDELSWYNKAVLLEKTGRFKDAIDAYNKTIRINPENEQAWFNKGNILWSHYILNESLESFDTVISLDPNMSQAWYFRGLVLKQLGQLEEAANSFEHAMDLSPQEKTYRAYYQKYQKMASNPEIIKEKTLPIEYRSLLVIFPLIIIVCTWIAGFCWFWKRKKN